MKFLVSNFTFLPAYVGSRFVKSQNLGPPLQTDPTLVSWYKSKHAGSHSFPVNRMIQTTNAGKAFGTAKFDVSVAEALQPACPAVCALVKEALQPQPAAYVTFDEDGG